ncbi:unnamed protein product [Amoebophrya sp. A25]|nr:unnamed protein product [Amoebophrya sp. A25]|eukprot:GSA25T00004029001.1
MDTMTKMSNRGGGTILRFTLICIPCYLEAFFVLLGGGLFFSLEAGAKKTMQLSDYTNLFFNEDYTPINSTNSTSSVWDGGAFASFLMQQLGMTADAEQTLATETVWAENKDVILSFTADLGAGGISRGKKGLGREDTKLLSREDMPSLGALSYQQKTVAKRYDSSSYAIVFKPPFPEVTIAGTIDYTGVFGKYPSFQDKLFPQQEEAGAFLQRDFTPRLRGSVSFMQAENGQRSSALSKVYGEEPNPFVTRLTLVEVDNAKEMFEKAKGEYEDAYNGASEQEKSKMREADQWPKTLEDFIKLSVQASNIKHTCTSTNPEDIAEQMRINGRKHFFEKIYLAWAFGKTAEEVDSTMARKNNAKTLVQRSWNGFTGMIEQVAASLKQTTQFPSLPSKEDNRKSCENFVTKLSEDAKSYEEYGPKLDQIIRTTDCEHVVDPDAVPVVIWKGFDNVKAKSLEEALFFRFVMKDPNDCAKAIAEPKDKHLKGEIGNLHPVCIYDVDDVSGGENAPKPEPTKVNEYTEEFKKTAGPVNDMPHPKQPEGFQGAAMLEPSMQSSPIVETIAVQVPQDSAGSDDAPHGPQAWNEKWMTRLRKLWKGQDVNFRILQNLFYSNMKEFEYLVPVMARAIEVPSGEAGNTLMDDDGVKKALQTPFPDEKRDSARMKFLSEQFALLDDWREFAEGPKGWNLWWHHLIPKWSMLLFDKIQKQDGAAVVRNFLPLSPSISSAERAASLAVHPGLDKSSNHVNSQQLVTSVYGTRAFQSNHCYSAIWPLQYEKVEQGEAEADAPKETFELKPTGDAKKLSGIRIFFPEFCDPYGTEKNQMKEEFNAAANEKAQQEVLDKCQPKAYVTPIRAIDESGFLRMNGPSGSAGDMMQFVHVFGNAQTADELATMRLHMVANFAYTGAHSFIEILLGSEAEFQDKDPKFQMRTILEHLQNPASRASGIISGLRENPEQLYKSVAYLWDWFHNAEAMTNLEKAPEGVNMDTLADEYKIPEEHKRIHEQFVMLAREVALAFVPESLRLKSAVSGVADTSAPAIKALLSNDSCSYPTQLLSYPSVFSFRSY